MRLTGTEGAKGHLRIRLQRLRHEGHWDAVGPRAEGSCGYQGPRNDANERGCQYELLLPFCFLKPPAPLKNYSDGSPSACGSVPPPRRGNKKHMQRCRSVPPFPDARHLASVPQRVRVSYGSGIPASAATRSHNRRSRPGTRSSHEEFRTCILEGSCSPRGLFPRVIGCDIISYLGKDGPTASLFWANHPTAALTRRPGQRCPSTVLPHRHCLGTKRTVPAKTWCPCPCGFPSRLPLAWTPQSVQDMYECEVLRTRHLY